MANKIYIAMATYNGEKYLGSQIDSIIAQDYTDWILLVHDDGSSDLTVRNLEQYAEHDKRIILLRDGKVFHNSNRNFIHVLKSIPDDCDYVFLSDQDDIWKENKISSLLAEIKKIESKNSLPLCIATDLSLIDSQGRVFVPSFWDYAKTNAASTFSTLLVENTATGCSMLMNAKALSYIKSLDDCDAEKIIQHDWFIALVCSSDGIYFQLKKAFTLYRQHENNVLGARKFSVFKRLFDGKVIASIKRIRNLKKKVFVQGKLVEHVIKNVGNKKIAAQYFCGNFFARKFVFLKNGMLKGQPFMRKIIYLLFY